MAQPVEVLADVRGYARDYPRDRIPEGFMWDVADYVPALLDAQLSGRGGWKWGSAAIGTEIQGGIHATFKTGERLLVIAGGTLYQIDMNTGAVSAPIGGVYNIVQNPVMLADQVIVPNADGQPPRVLTATAGGVTINAPGTAAASGRYATVYKGRVLLQGGPGKEDQVFFSPVRDTLQPWDAVRSWQGTSLPLTGIGALRAMILCFHAGSVERIRGTEPPNEGNPAGDLNLEPLFDRAGCGDARSISYWNDNCIFADERGVHFTDGAIVKNLISQGGLVVFWRELFANRISLAAETYLDYYVVTVIRSDGIAVTLVCDLQRRSWFRFTNVKATCYMRSFGIQEQLWAGRKTDNRLMTLSSCFFPVHTAINLDADGTAVLPVVETPYFKLGEHGRKRIRFVYTTYDIRTAPYGRTDKYSGLPPDPAEVVNGQAKAALASMLEVGYILRPMLTTYTIAGVLPETDGYRRYRLPVNKHPYGIALRFRQVAASVGTHIFDMEIEAQASERSRV